MKKTKKASRSDPINVTKDITIFSTIGKHDLEVKMSHLKGFLERGNSARVFVQTKYRRGMDEVKEEESREAMLKKIVSELEGLGKNLRFQRVHTREEASSTCSDLSNNVTASCCSVYIIVVLQHVYTRVERSMHVIIQSCTCR